MTFSYANSRVRVWKGELVDNNFFEQLLDATDADNAMAMLSQTPYQKFIEKGIVRYEGVWGAEEGLKLNLADTLQRLYRIGYGDEETASLIKLVLAKWDIYNLKTVLRGLHSSSGMKEIEEQLIPAGNLDETDLQILIKQTNVKAAIDQVSILCPQYAPPLIKGYSDYKQSNSLANLELGLDNFYYKYVLKQSIVDAEGAGVIRQVTRREIDFTNLMTLFRLIREQLPEGIKIEQYFIFGGYFLKVDRLIELSKLNDMKTIIESLKTTPYYNTLKQGYQKFEETGSLASMERIIEDYNIKKNIALFREDPLSIATIVAYLYAKINEITNIRIILRGKQIKMPSKDIKEALVLV